MALLHGTTLPTPSGTSLGTFSVFLLLHSQCLSMSIPCSSAPGGFEALIVLLKQTGWFPECRDAGPCPEATIHPHEWLGQHHWVLAWREQGSPCPATHQHAWKSLVGQTESLGLKEMWAMPASPFVAEMFLVRRKKRKISVCFFLRRLLSAHSLYLVIIKGLFCCQ